MSKYGNKKVKFNGETFDSKLELDYYRYLLNQKVININAKDKEKTKRALINGVKSFENM